MKVIAHPRAPAMECKPFHTLRPLTEKVTLLFSAFRPLRSVT